MSDKVYDVPAEWAKRAWVNAGKYEEMYKRSVNDPQGFWAEHGKRIDWFTPFTKVKNTSFDAHHVSIKWFEDGVTNVAHNCIDRHLPKRAKQTAIIWEGDDPSKSKHITYAQLADHVGHFANVLKGHGVKKGDRVTIYLPMIPEAAYAMLACARIGAIHSIVFGGFSPDALAGRIADAKSEIVITADEGLRGGRKVPLKANVDVALEKADGVKHVIVVKHTGGEIGWQAGRDVWLHEAVKAVTAHCPPEPMNAEDPLFILYTSGSTGAPKGVVHTTGGYLVFTAMTHQYVFDYHDGDVYWCTADVGWVTGHSYIVYGPLANGATTLMFEGIPNYPSMSRFWEVIDKHQVNIFYTAPTAIRSLMSAGEDPVKKTSRKSLRLLGSVGEPINPEAWEWYHRVVGEHRCPIVDTWWQTETGGILITPLPGVTRLKPGSATRPFFGVIPEIVDAAGNVQEGACEGNLVIARLLARTVAHGLRRPCALREHLFRRLSGQVLHRRRRAARRGWLLLDHRARRRRDQRVRPSHGNGGSRERARRPPESVRGRCRRLSARHQGPGHLRLCDRDGRGGAERGAAQRTRRVGAQGDRADRLARPDPVRSGPAQDPLGQDHASHPAQDRGKRIRRARRHVDARRSGGRRRTDRQPAEPRQGLTPALQLGPP